MSDSTPSTSLNSNDQSETIKVFVRIRPMQKQEKLKGEKVCVKPMSLGKEVQIKTDFLEAQIYKCNYCFPRETSQESFFNESNITSLIDSAIAGYRSCAFAFGQTGAGKTYTVVGPSKSISPGSENDGLIGRSLDYMYNQLKSLNRKFSVRISCLEIYHENVYDLLSDDRIRPSLAIREHSVEGFFLEGCKMVSCQTFKQACSVIDIAMKNRHIGEHELNARSSRSHCITEIYIDLPNNSEISEDFDETAKNNNLSEIANSSSNSTTYRQRDFISTGKLTLVDLAGSERLKSTHSTGKILQDAGYINKSLYVLGKVIAGLARTHGDINHRDVPYRDSKLTKILINSLGGRGRTLLIACVTEASGSQAETLRTLKFSMSCARIKNRPVKFLDPHEKLIIELRDEIRRLRFENKKLRSSLLSAPSDIRRTNNDVINSPVSDEGKSNHLARRAISAEEIIKKNNSKHLNKKKKPLKNKLNFLKNYDDRDVNSPTDNRIRLLEDKLSNLEHNNLSKQKKYSLSPEKHDQSNSRMARNQVQFVDAVDLLEERNRKKIKLVYQADKIKNEVTKHSLINKPDSKNTSIESIKPKQSHKSKPEKPVSKSISGDILSDYLDSINIEDEDKIKVKKKKKNNDDKNKNVVKKVSPYVAHLASNPDKIKEIVKDRVVPNNKSIPFSNKQSNNAIDFPAIPTSKQSNTTKYHSNSITKIEKDEIIDSEVERIELPNISTKSPKFSKDEDPLINRVTTKLTELEKQLLSTRHEMEDNPGYVTSDAENNLLKLEKEVVEMKRELNISMPNSPSLGKTLLENNSTKNIVFDVKSNETDDEYYDEEFDNENEYEGSTFKGSQITTKEDDILIDNTNSNKMSENVPMTVKESINYNDNSVNVTNSNNNHANNYGINDSLSGDSQSLVNNMDNSLNSKESEFVDLKYGKKIDDSDNYYDDTFSSSNKYNEQKQNDSVRSTHTKSQNNEEKFSHLEDKITNSNSLNSNTNDMGDNGYEDDFDD